MKIAVCVKHVPDGRLRLDDSGKQLARNVPGDINDADTNAIEEALRVKASHDGEVVVLSMGPAAAGRGQPSTSCLADAMTRR